MSKAYSNKALPAGTVIREWRLEDVLGVGGFGIVYRGRGIYFGELVAIKEYFPSSISERDAEDTVVPIGSDVEEVHALGLKKFVEEAKLLWNLSTPSRHPNIVSVRSLFEVHGTAYMVMDFEDGVSLSKLLREGRRFNERSLWNIIQPIAEGLDRAHRVGVLHRDIKPPNILITNDSRPVLIDFGSARFEAAEATSTTVTFHTPPYAAIEQYVKTYPQGPWTDVYALGVVLYECVTGEKPPEVLERMHGGLGKPLADSHWPGFSKRFLEAIDTAMIIRPADRPQSTREWLALFGKEDPEAPVGGDDEPTRFFAHEVAAKEIAPVPPTGVEFDSKEPLETQVPTDPKDVQFKRAGEETGVSKKKKKVADLAEPVVSTTDAAPEALEQPPSPPAKKAPAGAAKPPAAAPAAQAGKNPRGLLLAGLGAVAALAAVSAGYFMLGKKAPTDSAQSLEIPDVIEAGAGATSVEALNQLVAGERSLADDARTAGAPASAVNVLTAAGAQLDQQLAALPSNPAQGGDSAARIGDMTRTATAANVDFAKALLNDADARARNVPANATAGKVSSALSDLRSSVAAAASSADPVQSLGAARDALAKSRAFAAAVQGAFGAQAATKRAADSLAHAAKPVAVTTATNSAIPAATAVPTAVASSVAGVSPAKRAQLNAIVSSGRGLARQVIGQGDGGSPAQKSNAQLARGYDKYLATVGDSMRGANSDREVDDLIKKANQTKAYIVFLSKQSSKAQ